MEWRSLSALLRAVDGFERDKRTSKTGALIRLSLLTAPGVGDLLYLGAVYKIHYSVSQKIPPEDLWQFFLNGWEFFNQILHAYYAFLSALA